MERCKQPQEKEISSFSIKSRIQLATQSSETIAGPIQSSSLGSNFTAVTEGPQFLLPPSKPSSISPPQVLLGLCHSVYSKWVNSTLCPLHNSRAGFPDASVSFWSRPGEILMLPNWGVHSSWCSFPALMEMRQNSSLHFSSASPPANHICVRQVSSLA